MNKNLDITDLRNRRFPESQFNKTNKIRSNRGRQLSDIFNKDVRLFSKPFPDKIKESFYIELNSLTEAGLDLRTSLELMRDEQQKKKYRNIIDGILTNIVAGSTLSASMGVAACFTNYEIISIRVGEETGRLNIVLKQLTSYLKSKIQQRRQIISTLTYPAIVLTVAFTSVFFMMNYVVPMFADVFKRFGGELPAPTRMVLTMSTFIKSYIFYFLILIMAGIAFIIIYKNKKWFKKYYSKVILKTPLLNNLILKIYLSRLAGTLSLLCGANIPLTQAIILTSQMIGFYPLEKALIKMEGEIMSGLPLHQCLAGNKIFPVKMVTFVKVGEEVNQLDSFFSRIAEEYTKELEYKTNILSKFIEPAIIIILGIVVAFILIAMYLPLFNIGETIQ